MRKYIKKKDEADVLIQSRRRCALCYGLNQDYSIKRGQIAHLDGDNENNKRENLVFLCLPHHDEYDSKTSQSKGITKKEILHYQELLIEHIKKVDEEVIHKFEAGESDNQFYLYKLTNPDSICGFPYLAADRKKQFYLEISENITAVQSVYWEVNQWLNADYTETGNAISFPLKEISREVNNFFFEKDFSLICYKSNNKTESIVLTFNESHKYYEIQYNIMGDNVEKVAMGNNIGLDENIQEYGVIKKLTKLLDEFNSKECP